jgi:hypothetical protein
MRKLAVSLTLLALLALACGATVPSTPSPVPTQDVGAAVTQTLAAITNEAATGQSLATNAASTLQTVYTVAAQTVEAVLTQSAVPVITASSTPTDIINELAPDPLPITNTDSLLNVGECFDEDTGLTGQPDQQCDLYLDTVNAGLFKQMNGAKLSGYVTMTPPTRSHCATATYEPGDLAIQTDLYYCFISNQGAVGFIVVRQYMGMPMTGIVFDYWVFR